MTLLCFCEEKKLPVFGRFQRLESAEVVCRWTSLQIFFGGRMIVAGRGPLDMGDVGLGKMKKLTLIFLTHCDKKFETM